MNQDETIPASLMQQQDAVTSRTLAELGRFIVKILLAGAALALLVSLLRY